MTDGGPSRAGEPASAQPRYGANPLHGAIVVDDETGNHFTPHRPLPCRAERQKIVEHASLVLAAARALADESGG